MDCNNCGACCLDESVPVRPWAGDIIEIEFIDEEGCLKKVDGHCIFFDPKTRTCRNYEHRPSLCRSLKAGCGRCLLSRLWAELELSWFGESPNLPEDGSYENFYQRVHHDGNNIRILMITGRDTPHDKDALSRFNNSVTFVTEW